MGNPRFLEAARRMKIKESNSPAISLVEIALGRPNPQSGNALK
jgi:hypothetical protein